MPDPANNAETTITDPTTAAVRRAWVFTDPDRSGLEVASLTVLDRMLVALHRAGYGDISVVHTDRLPLPRTRRADALGIRYVRVSSVPAGSGLVLAARAEVLVQTGDIRRLGSRPGRLVGRGGELLPIGIVEGSAGNWEAALADLPVVPAEGVACRVRDREEAISASRDLWNSLTSSSDGWVDRVFNRPVGRPLARWLSRTWVTPNQISVASVLLGVVAGGMFALGQHAWLIAGALLFQLSAVLDCVDGDVARVVFKESPLGKWLDLVGDQVVHVSVFAGIATGLLARDSTVPAGWLGVIAVAGALLSFGVVLRGMKRSREKGGDQRLARLLDAATNRDFSVLVLILSLADRLEVFLWLAAVGSHLFWMMLAWLQRKAWVTPDRRGVA